MLLRKTSTNIVATILAKNEADIIGQQIEHHIEQGVSSIIFTDNNSTDNTVEIVSKYPEVKEIIHEPGNDHKQNVWVTRMAHTALKLKPDWIVHLDADEFWCGLGALREFDCEVVGCQRMYLHPPINKTFDLHAQRFYLSFDHLPIPQECKVAHRPIEGIEITHGNHGVVGDYKQEFTDKIYRHHYPVRSYEQWARKAEGHVALKRGGNICARWERWYNMLQEGKLESEFNFMIKLWSNLINYPIDADIVQCHQLMESWCEPEAMELFKKNYHWIPKILERTD